MGCWYWSLLFLDGRGTGQQTLTFFVYRPFDLTLPILISTNTITKEYIPQTAKEKDTIRSEKTHTCE